MRYVRCHECGSTEVPTLATCPACGIKTPIRIRQHWWLLGLTVTVGAGLGLVVTLGVVAFRRSERLSQLESEVDQLRAEIRAQQPPDQALQRRLNQLETENVALRSRLGKLTGRPPADPPTSLTPAPGNDRLRHAHVHWAAAYRSVSRLWREPYVPFGFVDEMDPELDVLEGATRRLAALLADAGDDASKADAAALKDFERQMLLMRQTVRPGRRQRITVSALNDWVDGGIRVRRGDLVYLAAQGSWTMATIGPPDEDDPAPIIETIPLVGALPLGAVLWRVDSGDRTHALLPDGASATDAVEAAGTLQFRINEQRLEDNAGAVAVEVLVIPRQLIIACDTAELQLIGG